jgi:putative colanic acid biosynthesis acetyltransferase WcaF
MLLRLFGARVGHRCLVRRTAFIEIPWHLVYSLATISIGDRTIISQGAHLCAGDHDMDRPGWILRRIPISIGSDAWIAADAFVGPGVDIGCGVVLGARAAAFRDLPDWTVCVGVPAKPSRTRSTSAHLR